MHSEFCYNVWSPMLTGEIAVTVCRSSFYPCRYGRYIEPLLSLSIDFYCRVFVRVHTGQAVCKQSTSKLGHVYQCTGCESLAVQPLGRLSTHKNGGQIKYNLPTGPPVDRLCAFCINTHHIGINILHAWTCILDRMIF